MKVGDILEAVKQGNLSPDDVVVWQDCDGLVFDYESTDTVVPATMRKVKDENGYEMVTKKKKGDIRALVIPIVRE